VKIVLIGAGSAQFGFDMLGDIFSSATLAGAEIALVDINGEALARTASAAAAFGEQRKLPFRIASSIDRRTVLAGADFVVISIEVGDRFGLWDMDWALPLQFGIRQVYGENGGPGGLFHALRITPPILDICADVEKLCPGATVFCYSNPMTAISTTVHRRFPGMKFVGMCHEIASLARYLPAILDTPLENLHLRAAGLNHFSVLVEASYADSGRDAYPDIMARAPAFFEKEIGYSDVLEYMRRTGKAPETEGTTHRFRIGREESSRPWSDRALFKYIMERFGLLPITTDSHVGEYVQWAHDVADHRGIHDFYDLYRMSLARGDATIQLERQERAVFVMEGMVGDTGYEEGAVNIPNDGFIPDLPGFVAVEVPAVVRKKGLHGHRFASYPKAFGALLRNYCGVYDLTAEAILTGKRECVVQALLVNPVVDTCARIDELVDLVLERQRPWLDYIAR
jgi:alpha-galactosidase